MLGRRRWGAYSEGYQCSSFLLVLSEDTVTTQTSIFALLPAALLLTVGTWLVRTSGSRLRCEAEGSGAARRAAIFDCRILITGHSAC